MAAVGEQISHYRIVSLLGSGGMGVVYEAEDLSLLALRFESDKLSPCARFQTLERELGRRAELHTLPDASARQGTGRAPHSVLTIHLNRDDPEGETMKVHRRVLDFFKERTGA